MSEIAIEVLRGGMVENVIRADIAVVDKEGKLRYFLGDEKKMTYMRSCSKPVQAMVPVESGVAERFGLTESELAIMCASHNGEAMHVQAVRSILQKIGLDESYLQCGDAYSFGDPTVSEDYMRRGIPSAAVINNCSGKHSAMLALCVLEGYSTDDYYKPEHPVQQRILDKIAQYTRYPKQSIGIGVDGCGVPVFAVPLYNTALAYATFSDRDSEDRTALRLARAMTDYPEMISGTNGFTSKLMRAAGGKIIAKEGADGVYCMGLRDKGLGVCIKTEDGNLSHICCIAMSVLRQLNALTEAETEKLSVYEVKDNLNCRKEIIGKVHPVFELLKA